jgi:hypothetical protein
MHPDATTEATAAAATVRHINLIAIISYISTYIAINRILTYFIFASLAYF